MGNLIRAGYSMEVRGSGYTIHSMDVVRSVDELHPEACVDEEGNWWAEEPPVYGPALRPRDPNQPAIVFCCDRSYFPGLQAALASLREIHPDVPVVILERGLSERQIKYLSQFAEVYPSASELPPGPEWARFEISLLPYARIVYLDCDLIVLDRLDALLNTSDEFVAVRNLDWTIADNFYSNEPIEAFGVDPGLPAFNSGIFSINNRVWGNGVLLREAVRVWRASADSLRYGDQPVLQIIMNTNGRLVTFLDDHYNAIAECWDAERTYEGIRILHFAGDEIKPWDPRCRYPQLNRFFQFSKIRQFVNSDFGNDLA